MVSGSREYLSQDLTLGPFPERCPSFLAGSRSLTANAYTPTATGYGHIYQGRFKSFPVEQAALNVIRYVERNALRANLVEQAQDWRWCSLWRKLNDDRDSLLSA